MSRKRRRKHEAPPSESLPSKSLPTESLPTESPRTSYVLWAAMGLLLVALLVGWRLSLRPDPQELFEQAQAAYATDPARSESLARQAIESSAESFDDAKLLLVCALAKRNAWPEVQRTLAGIDLSECRSDLLLDLGRILRAGNQPETAVHVLQPLRARSGPEQVEGLLLLAGLFQATGPSEALAGVFEDLTRAEPNDPRWWNLLARVYAGVDDPRLVEVYRDAINQSLPPEHALATRYKLIERLIFLGQATEARSELEQVEKILASAGRADSSRQQAKIDVYRARLLRLEGRPAEALTVLERTRGELGDVPELIRLRGMLFLDTGDLEQAAGELARAAELLPQDEIVHFKLAEVYRRQGEAELADRHRREYERMHQAALEIAALRNRAANGDLTEDEQKRLAELQRQLSGDEVLP